MMRSDTTSSGRDLFRDEHGLTTTSMVLSLLVTLSLLFTAAQVYRVNSASAEVQDVADAAALAAENQVAEFMLVARYCDAVILSLSLTGITVTGLGIAALCTPATAKMERQFDMWPGSYSFGSDDSCFWAITSGVPKLCKPPANGTKFSVSKAETGQPYEN